MYKFFKRLGDVFLSGFAILVLSPLLLPVMAILKCTGEHDIFYGQDRIGYKNKHFKILKFATMLRNSPNMSGGLHTTHGDPRVLPFGRFLRKTKINELPQLFNILFGDMSIVGPRPEMIELVEDYSKTLPDFRLRHKVKAGLTGYAQIYGKYNGTVRLDDGRVLEIKDLFGFCEYVENKW